VGGPFRVCYEASLGYGAVHDALAPLASQVAVAHPGRLRVIFQARKKNDRIDAHKLARMMFLDELPEIHVPSVAVREWRVLIEHRRRLIDKRTAAKNGLRAVLRGQGIDAPRGNRMWTKAGAAWAASVEFASELTALRRDQLLLEIEHMGSSIKVVEKRLDRLAEKDPRVRLLRTIPGVGPRTAEAVVAWVDKPERFTSTRHAASYFGLVPSLDESGAVKRYGRITKQGPATVRKLLVEASWRAVALEPSMRETFERVKAGKKERAGRAVVAVAHRLVRVMVAMLKSGQPWRTGEEATPMT
jgi:transposase